MMCSVHTSTSDDSDVGNMAAFLTGSACFFIRFVEMCLSEWVPSE